MAAAQATQTAPESDGIELPEASSGRKLTLEEMTRIMDVATTLRKEKAVVEAELNIDQTKAKLRERLLAAAKESGDPVTEAEIDAAIEAYYARMHEFAEPRFGFRTLLAHLWVRRRPILAVLAGFAAIFVLIWALLASGALPGAAQNQQTFQSIERNAAAVEKISRDSSVEMELDSLVKSAKAALDKGEAGKLAEIATKIEAVQAQLESQYSIVIASGADEQTGQQRMWTDDKGTRNSGYYVIVQARDAQGKPVTVPIENRESGKTEMVSRWAEQVPEDVFNRLAADKEADGVLDEKVFGVKERGERAVKVELKGAGGAPITRQGQITSWQ